MSLIGFALKNWKYLLISAVSLFAGFTIAWKMQELKVVKLESELKSIKQELSQCREALESNLGTIENLKKEIWQAEALCKKRLKTKEETLRALQRIDELGERKDEKGHTVDTMLDALRGMFP